MATLIKADGSISFIKPKGKFFEAQELHELVGGYFEMVGRLQPGTYGLITVAPGDVLWCNEDGHRLQLPVNRTATAIYHQAGGLPHFPVLGDIVITGEREID